MIDTVYTVTYKEVVMANAKAASERAFQKWMESGYRDQAAYDAWQAARERWANARIK